MKQNLWRIIGAYLVALAFVLTWMKEPGWAWGVLAAVGILDYFVCEVLDQHSISRLIQDLTKNKIIDYCMLTGLSVFTLTLAVVQYGFVLLMQVSLPLFMIILLVHFLADRD